MCGISAVLDPEGTSSQSFLAALHRSIAHRGPDGEGFLVLQGTQVQRADAPLQNGDRLHVGMAFRRLKILDLSPAAAQPMTNADESLWITFNGEIYNFPALRSELTAAGHRFRSSGDTEVVLAAYEEWGTGCFERFEGMWAIVLLDLRRRQLVISRDRFGIKPLYWSVDGSRLLLCSEPKQITTARDGRAKPNGPLVAMYLRGGRYPFIDETFFEGIHPVPPATFATVDIDRALPVPQFRPYWNLADFTCNGGRRPPYEEALEEVETTLWRAAESHLVSDVRVGALLSGGVDSATLVGLLANRSSRRLPTFSLGYRDAAPDWCELRYVDAMVQRDRLENHQTTLDADWVLENVDRVLWAFDEPPLGMAALAQYRVFQLCRDQGVTVVLDGQGSDEITAGYQYHQRLFLKDRLVKRKPLQFASELAAIARREHRTSAAVLNEFFVAPRFRPRVTADWVSADPPRSNHEEFVLAANDYGRDRSLVNGQLYFDVRWGNVKIILGYGDRSSMAHSLEARVPYFDRKFVELLFTLPDSFKIGDGDRKRILRDVARRHVPSAITERVDRMGFGVPEEEMLRGPMWKSVEESVLDEQVLRSGFVVADRVRRLLLDFRQGVTHDYRAVWRLYAFARWAKRFEIAL